MKKLLFSVLAMATISVIGCGNKAQQGSSAPADAPDTEAVTTDTTALSPEARGVVTLVTANLAKSIKEKDEKALKTALADIAAGYKAMANAGHLEDALTYGQLVKDFLAQYTDKIKQAASSDATIPALLKSIQALPTDAKTTVKSAKQAVGEDVVGLASTALQKAGGMKADAGIAADMLKQLPGNSSKAAEGVAAKTKEVAARKAEEVLGNAREKMDKSVDKAMSDAREKAEKRVDEATAAAKKGLGL